LSLRKRGGNGKKNPEEARKMERKCKKEEKLRNRKEENKKMEKESGNPNS